MVVVKPWEEVEVEVEDKEVALRGRLPRQQSNTTTTVTTSKVGDESSDKSSESSSDEEVNGTPRNGGVSNGENGETKSTNGHSGFDDRYADFPVSDETPADQTLELNTADIKVENISIVNYQYEVKVEKNASSAAFSSSPSSQQENGKYVSRSNGTITTTTTTEPEEANTRSRNEEEEEKGQELDLERLYQRQGQHEFVCPNCRACITKVIIRELEIRPPSSPPPRRIRCTSCFSFLSLAGKIFWPDSNKEDTHILGEPVSSDGSCEPPRVQSSQAVSSTTVVAKQIVVASITETTQPLELVSEMPSDQKTEPAPTNKTREHKLEEIRPNQPSSDNSNEITGLQEQVPSRNAASVLEEPIVVSRLITTEHSITGVQEKVPPTYSYGTLHDKKNPLLKLFGAFFSAKRFRDNLDKNGHSETRINITTRDPILAPIQGPSKSWEILKSIVYGGIAESIASLGIVTSAASGDASTLNIVSLALANLLGGLFIIVHNIWELKGDKSKVHCSRTNELVDRYQEVLGRRENFILHAFAAILSFLVFGLVPPVVYGFTFRQTDDKDLKLAAVAAASLICIALLAIAKAQIQNPHKYFKTVTYYIVIGLGVSGVSYLAGQLINQLIEKFESSESTPAFTLPLPGMGIAKWGSY
ncbi:hypothetical protein TIFTF001_019443 [Ficus carica]|uniref:Membrane protein of ER body-like protein n=1 Tax=Ficus carica TaxID=3494 RepID=A0AA88ASZ2_FICCA|nr:hypothetical protein TIFTF001_019443 [Ficus carica]